MLVRHVLVILLQESVLKVSHEETGIAGAHFSSHRYATHLREHFITERKYQFCKTDQSVGRGMKGCPFVEEMFERCESVSVGDAGV